MEIPANVIFIWTGTDATIPSGWTRETTLDGKFAKAWGAENPNVTGGADTHVHSSPSHVHTMAHTHTYLLTQPISFSGNNAQSGTFDLLVGTHTHTGTSGASTVADTSATAVTYASVSNDPPYRKIIFIKASTTARLTTDMVALYNSNTPPSNWSNVTELQGRYLKGAGTGADSDLVTDNGSTTNSHTITHVHSVPVHSHGDSTSSGPGGSCDGSNDASDVVNCSHTHTVTFNASVAFNSNNNSAISSQSETVEPIYTKLQAIKKGINGRKEKGIIGLWLGTAASIPTSFRLMDGTNGTKDCRDKFIKIGNPSETDGGSNTHVHAAQSHSHTTSGHVHLIPEISNTAAGNAHHGGESSNTYFHKWEPHPQVNTATSAFTTGTTSTTANSSDNQPTYRTVVYIQLANTFLAAGML